MVLYKSFCIIVNLCKYFPRSQAFSLMCADYRVYAQASRQSRGVVASDCAILAYTGAYQVENIYKDELYQYTYFHTIWNYTNYTTWIEMTCVECGATSTVLFTSSCVPYFTLMICWAIGICSTLNGLVIIL